MEAKKTNKSQFQDITSLIKIFLERKYFPIIFFIIALACLSNYLTLEIPKLTGWAIEEFVANTYSEDEVYSKYLRYGGGILILALTQYLLSSILSEKFAYDLRARIVQKISKQNFQYIQKQSSSKLLTHITSDVDAVKGLISQGLVIVFSAAILLTGSAYNLFNINAKLSFAVILVIPFLLGVFAVIFSRISKYFKQSQEVIDELNQVINETIVGAPLVRVLNSSRFEVRKFKSLAIRSKEIGLNIVLGFAALVPSITLVLNIAYLIIITYGGIRVIDSQMSFGDLTTFFGYIATFLFPILSIGFLGSIFTRAFESYKRIKEILDYESPQQNYSEKDIADGLLKVEGLSIAYDGKDALKDISFEVRPNTKTAIIGPTAAGKTQLLYAISNLTTPDKGLLTIDGIEVNKIRTEELYKHMAIVFQDSVIFNSSLRENITLGDSSISEETIDKALRTSQMYDFVDSLEEGLDTLISERGTSLSGGQKQRLTLARALVREPKLLLLDDFTARVDIGTEKKIFANLTENYPSITIISVTQKISSVKDYENIILLMEGEMIAQGTHDELLSGSLEYKQIFNSQRSFNE